jgi:hypothetical protein
VWQQVAERRGGHFSSVGGLELDVEADGVAVHFDLHGVSTGRIIETYTRARTPYLIGSGPLFLIQGKLRYHETFGFASVEVADVDLVLGGNREFDKKFEVRCNDLLATREVWSALARKLMVEQFADGGASCDGEVVSMLSTGVASVEILDKMIEVVVAVATCGRAHLEAAARLPDARWLRPENRWIDRTALAVEVPLPPNSAVRFTSEFGGGHWQLCASLPCDRSIELFWSTLSTEGHVQPAPPDGVLGDALADSWHAFGASKLSFDGEALSLSWPASERDPQRMPAAIAILSEIAKPSHGVYR